MAMMRRMILKLEALKLGSLVKMISWSSFIDALSLIF